MRDHEGEREAARQHRASTGRDDQLRSPSSFLKDPDRHLQYGDALPPNPVRYEGQLYRLVRQVSTVAQETVW